MKDFWHSSLWTQFLFFSTLSSLLAISHAQYSTSSTDSDDVASENAAGASGSGSSMISSKNHDMIIILSVIVGVVAVLGVSSAILFLVAKKRQWAVREAMRRSTRRAANAIKSPLTPRFPKSPRDAPPPPGARRIETARSVPFNQRSKSGRDQNELKKEQELDLERGIELGATKTSSVRVSTKESNGSNDSDGNAPKRGWGTFFSFGRH